MRNRLLDALPQDVTPGFQSYFERVSLERGTVLHHPGDTIRHLYFPLNCLVSITVTMREGKTAEAGAAGNREAVRDMDLRLTQEFIGEMLGVHRPTVTEIAKKLEEQGLITVQRGLIRISDLQGLERIACECYTVVKEE